MTFVNLQDRVMARLNLTTTAARTRIKDILNERLRRVATSTNVGRTRYGAISTATVAATPTVTTTGGGGQPGIIKVRTVSIPLENRVLDERTVDQMKTYDPDLSQTGIPRFYAIQKINATTLLIRLWPTPDAVYTLTIEGILAGTDMSADADVPGMPEDFHDMLVYGALADEYPHLEKTDLALFNEQKFEKRLSDLKYFIAKSAYLRRVELGDPWGMWWLFPTGW